MLANDSSFLRPFDSSEEGRREVGLSITPGRSVDPRDVDDPSPVGVDERCAAPCVPVRMLRCSWGYALSAQLSGRVRNGPFVGEIEDDVVELGDRAPSVVRPDDFKMVGPLIRPRRLGAMNGAGLPATTITGMVPFVGDTDSIQPFQ